MKAGEVDLTNDYPWFHWCLITKSYPTLCNPMDCSPPGSSVHGEGCHFLLQRIFLTQGSNPHCCIGRQFVYHRATWEAPWFHYNLHKSCIWLCFCLLFSLRHSLLGVCGMWVCVCVCVCSTRVTLPPKQEYVVWLMRESKLWGMYWLHPSSSPCPPYCARQ